MKTSDDFKTEEEYEAYLEEQNRLWEAREPYREKLQEMLVARRKRVEELDRQLLDEAVAFADEHGLAFSVPWRAGDRLYISPGALELVEVAVEADGEPIMDDGYSRYTEYGDELEAGWNYWEPSRNC